MGATRMNVFATALVMASFCFLGCRITNAQDAQERGAEKAAVPAESQYFDWLTTETLGGRAAQHSPDAAIADVIITPTTTTLAGVEQSLSENTGRLIISAPSSKTLDLTDIIGRSKKPGIAFMDSTVSADGLPPESWSRCYESPRRL